MFDLATRDIKFISGVGPQKAAVLNKELEIYSLHDLIYYFPYKYIDRSRIYYIHEIDGNMPYIQLKGEILGFETIGEGRQRRLTAHFSDGTVKVFSPFSRSSNTTKRYPSSLKSTTPVPSEKCAVKRR